VRQLIAQHIDSIEQLEVLLLLRNQRERSWTVDAIIDQMRSSANSVQTRLRGLVQHGLVEHQDGAYRYATGADLDSAVGDLASAYAEQRFSVIDLIFSKPGDKLRVFADAFRVGPDGTRKRGKGDG
jgi:hypothetical protein